jgi:SAM-dependent MidA family methyltransferase
MTPEGRVPGVPGYRRQALPDPEDAGEDEALVARIRAEIAERGPIPFARFMERALYEPGHGYYRRAESGPGMAGADFLTAPEAHPIVGAAIGRLVEQAWEAMGRPAPFTVIEPGAGTGALAAGLLGGLRALGSPLSETIRYRPVEVEPARLVDLRRRLAADGLEGRLAPAEVAEPTAGALVANEVLDALPVHRVVGRADGLRELLVTVDPDGAFAWHEAEATTPDLAARLAAEDVTLADGEVTEICLAIDGWLARATAGLTHGIVVLVDYAAEPADLHGRARPTGTLRAFARHAVGSDPFRHVGRQDLTATVDLAAVRAAAARAGLVPLGETTQGELLARAGTRELTDAYLARRGATLQDALHLRSALARLLDPRGMGGFRVLVFGRGLRGGTPLALLERLRRPGAPDRPGRPDEATRPTQGPSGPAGRVRCARSRC